MALQPPPSHKAFAGTERRAKAAKARKLNERRRDMLILSSATQADIYIWAISLVVMGIVLGGFIIMGIIQSYG